MRALLLDLDGTLIDERGASEAAFEALLAAHRPGLPEDRHALASWRAVSARHWMRYELGEVSFLEQRRCRVREFLGQELSDEEADQAYLPYANAYERSWRLLPGALAFLDRTRQIPKVIITNGDRMQQMRKVRATGLAEYVMGIVTPSDCGHWKPHPGIFLAGLALLGVDPSECLMIGDDEARDIEPAKQLGMQHFHVQAGQEEHGFSRLVAEWLTSRCSGP
jgi:putative hydrolase of the HAD superfamily